ncbi:MAG TPA: hypothetical protein VMU39_25145 [Solirubrobacteraceae bacterium]|nr:hypothetical protein [Solirubrobacteraceae bacterium]
MQREEELAAIERWRAHGGQRMGSEARIETTVREPSSLVGLAVDDRRVADWQPADAKDASPLKFELQP